MIIQSTTQRGNNVRGSTRLNPSCLMRPAIFQKNTHLQIFEMTAGAALPPSLAVPVPSNNNYQVVAVVSNTTRHRQALVIKRLAGWWKPVHSLSLMVLALVAATALPIAQILELLK